MTFIPIDEIQKIALEKHNENIEVDFQKLVEIINYNIQEEAKHGNFSVMINILSFEPVAIFKAQSMLKAQGYDCHKTGPHLVIHWDQEK